MENSGLIGGGGLGLRVGGREGGGFGDGGGELLGFDGIFVGEEGGGKLGQALAGGEGEGAIAEAGATGGFGKLLGNFFVSLEGRFGLVVAAKDFRDLHEEAKAIPGFFFANKVKILFVELNGVFFFVEVAVNISAALQNDFIFGKILEELIDGGAGLGDGARICEEASFAQAKPRKIGGFGRRGGIQIFVKISRERAVERVTHKGDHPGEGDLGLVGGFGKGEAGEKATDKEANIGGEAEVGFIDGAHGGGDPVSEKRADPVFGFGTNGIGAERVNVIGDGPLAKTGERKFKRAGKIPSVPTGVKGDLVPRNPFGGDFRFAIDLNIEAPGLKEEGGLFNPVVPQAIGVIFFLDGADVKKSAAGELGFFSIDRILDHAPNNLGGGAVEAANEDEVVREKLAEGADAFIRKVRVRDETIGGQAAEREKSEFRVNGGGVGPKLSHEGFGGEDGRILGNFEGHAPDEDHDPDGIF